MILLLLLQVLTLVFRNVEALLLKGNVLLDLKKLPDAMNHFREAMQIAGHRFEAHKVWRGGGRSKG